MYHTQITPYVIIIIIINTLQIISPPPYFSPFYPLLPHLLTDLVAPAVMVGGALVATLAHNQSGSGACEGSSGHV